MNDELFAQLLFRDEDNSLDFKSEQYKFDGATAEEKAEILKDILGFCNAWRDAPAYILIGVKHKRGERSEVIGIEDNKHLADHSLQQFVTDKTNRPIRFRYQAYKFEGKHVGIIHIEKQARPVWLKKKYGFLQQETVYVRRGSSTDLKAASLNEVLEMGKDAIQRISEIEVALLNPNSELAQSERVELYSEFYSKEHCDIDYDPSQIKYPFGLIKPEILTAFPLATTTNKNYYRQGIDFLNERNAFKPLRFCIVNSGAVASENVLIEVSFPNSHLDIIPFFTIDKPVKAFRLSLDRDPGIDLALKQQISRTSRDRILSITKTSNSFKLLLELGRLQPGREVLSELFYVAAFQSYDVIADVVVYADNLPEPKRNTFTLACSACVKGIDTSDLEKMLSDFKGG